MVSVGMYTTVVLTIPGLARAEVVGLALTEEWFAVCG